ncbi:P-loop NTPase fold protein [Psychrobacter glaciei]|uniref:P-loop NTPase fold protein n=1 Tax=Psychrobacter glaciei TaxID=619771 RepID=UPI001F05396F|nr:P-loop NTPase fold protein [Psychrobacter glaciei]MCH1781554.1 KAP family NTPase [Psychrobacter glaciei]
MANVVNLEKKLIDLMKADDSFAIALTGEWGIGKTHLWKNFRDKNREVFSGKKYAYISLFGLDSLESLKLAIATEVQTDAANDSPLNVDVSKHVKKLFGFVGGGNITASGDMRFGINIGNKLITNIIMAHLKDTLVCLDDIERKSDSLPMSEIMGLVNYLKNERNCQIIMILHDAESEDRDYFDKHKEKVFDELLVLDDSLSIVKSIVDSSLFTIYEQFYEIIGIKNLRFYQRVNKSFKLFDEAYPSLSQLSKEQILRFILIIRMAYDMPSALGNDVDFKFFVDSFNYKNIKDFRGYEKQNAYKRQDETPDSILNFKKINDVIHPFYNYFQISDWGELIVSWITELDFDQEATKNLIEKDKLTEETLVIDRLNSEILSEFHSLQIKANFSERLYYIACAKIGRAQLNNLSFYCDILEACNRKDLASQLETHIKRHIENSINYHQTRISIDDFYSFGRKENDRFYDFTVDTVENYKATNVSSDTISSIFLDFHKHNRRAWNSSDREILKLIDKDILREVIWANIDIFLGNRKLFIHSILLHPSLNELEGKREDVRLWILELLQEKIKDNPNSEPSIKMWLDDTKNLTENLA